MNKHKLSLEELQEKLYELIYLFDDYCKANNLKYFLVGGTLLGAVRHKGIIPWDDDIDVGMERSEYNRFIQLQRTKPMDCVEVHCHELETGYYYPQIKISLKNTYVDHYYFYIKGNTLGLHMDVFPYDGCPGNKQEAIMYQQRLHNKINDETWGLIHTKEYFRLLKFKQKLQRIPYFLLEKVCPGYVERRIKSMLELPKKYSARACNYCACVGNGIYGAGEVFPSTQLSDFSIKRFGTRDLPVLSGWQDYLSGIYGDYMTPPPPEKRVAHFDSSWVLE